MLNLLQKYKIKPSKKLGQNFLINEDVIADIMAAAEITKDDVVLEIGPGLGVLTKKLLEKAKKVVAVELDSKLFKIIKKETAKFPNIQILNQDILKITNQELLDCLYDHKNAEGEYIVAANIPYSITSLILEKFTSQEPRPKSMAIMLQKEVAQKITAKPGDLSILGIAVQLFYDGQYIKAVPAKDFFPVPKVDSAIVKLIKTDKYLNILKKEKIIEKDFFRIIKIGFSSKRKKLYNNLSAGLRISADEAKQMLDKVQININARAQELSIKDWIKLFLILPS